MVLATRIMQYNGHFYSFLPKDVAVWPKWTRFDRRNRGNFTLQRRRPYTQCLLRRRLLRTYTTSQIRRR